MTSHLISDLRPTPQERLALSRSALVKYMTQGDRPDSRPGIGYADARNNEKNRGQSTIWQSVKRAMRMWWQHHPAQLALDVAKPVLDNYAREKPLQLLGLAAGAGAAAVLIRPWRLVSMTGLLLATIKSTEFSGLLLSLLSNKPESTITPKDSS